MTTDNPVTFFLFLKEITYNTIWRQARKLGICDCQKRLIRTVTMTSSPDVKDQFVEHTRNKLHTHASFPTQGGLTFAVSSLVVHA